MSPPTFVARTPTDLIALAPLVIGFHPRDSVVLMTFGSPRRSFHARVDLEATDEGQEGVADVLVHAVTSNEVPRVAVLIYTDDAALAESQGRRLLDRLLPLGVEVIDVLRVDGDRWHAVPDDGSPGTAYDLETHAFTAQRVYEGHQVHADRAALVATLDDAPAEDREAVAEAAAAFEVVLEDESVPLAEHARWVQRAVRRLLGSGPPDAEDAGRLLVLADVVATRDVAWAEITREGSGEHVELWRDLVRRAPLLLVPGAASLLAFSAWQHGDGALAWCALDKCFEVDPDYSMARCLADLLTGAVAPTVWRPIAEHELPVFADERGEVVPRQRSGG